MTAKKTAQEGPPTSTFPLGWLTAIIGPLTRENLMSWVKLIVLVLVIRWLWFEPFSIPSDSMQPTLHGDPGFWKGDRVAVNKFVYGPRWPFNGAGIPFMQKRLWYSDGPIWRGKDPERWDIVVFRAVPEDAPHGILVKRIVGLPGERVHIADGKVHINGEPMELPESMPDVEYTTYVQPDAEQMRAILSQVEPAQRDYVERAIRREYREKDLFHYGVDDTDEYRLIPEDHYFVLGDNSTNSLDGRYFGWVPRKNLLGRVFCIWWRPSRIRDFTGFSHTWWGFLLVYGLPGLLALYILTTTFVYSSWRLLENSAATGLKKGDHVLISRLAYGFRVPFAGIYLGGKRPGPGDIVVYRSPNTKNLAIGTVARDKKGKKELTIEHDGADNSLVKETVPLPNILGSARRVWWPRSRARKIASAE